MTGLFPRVHGRSRIIRIGMVIIGGGLATAAVVDTTLEDFHLPGTQVFDVPPGRITTSGNCMVCHGPLQSGADPMSTWAGSLMAHGGRDPLFLAQMTTANQDVANVGYFCMRCHVPMSFVTGHALDVDGSTLDETDFDGVTCHFCHAMVDPIYKPGISPPVDAAILAGLDEVPDHYGNAMFVLDPDGTRRGPYADVTPPHTALYSPFHRTGDFCGTCHDVGNVAVTLQPDGTYRYNAIGEPPPHTDPCGMFPLERTYTEWRLSEFATQGVDMGGRFGGVGGPVVSTCQDCHMPRTVAQGCIISPPRNDLARHDFAGASAWVLEIVGLHYQGDPAVDQQALLAGRANAEDMLERAASLEVAQACTDLRVRVINETGHKLPTGHIEGRRVWLNVRMFNAADDLVCEYGHYDFDEAHLDEASTKIYEMHVGLSEDAADATGLPAGVTTHMALADTIMKDNRIPPRGFSNAAYGASGAPAVGATYADGQYWDDTMFDIPPGAVRAEVTVNYQTVTRHYIEALRDGNVTNDWGDILHDLWVQTDKGPPIPMVADSLTLKPYRPGDINCSGRVDVLDLLMLLAAWGTAGGGPADLDGNGVVNVGDLLILLANWG
jgi:hypothetical protein